MHHDILAHRDATGGDAACIAAEIAAGIGTIRPVHPLHRQPETDVGTVTFGIATADRYLFEMLQQRRTGVPRHRRRTRDHVLTAQRRQWNAGDFADAELRGQCAILGDDVLEHLPVVADPAAIQQVHLVDRQQHATNPEQRDDVAVPARLREQALARVHQHYRKLGGGCAGRHVARVLLMARAVGDDEFAFLGAEESVCHIDGDALLALGGQAIDQQREIDLAVLGAVAARIGFQRRELVVEQQLGVVQQAADQRAFSIVHAAAGDEAQQILALVLAQVIGDRTDRRSVVDARHQKYPSCFFFSIDADGSWSITRP